MNLDQASQKASTERSRLGKALKDLKDNTEKASRELALLKKAAEEKQKEELWNLINRAIDITDGAHEGAELALSHDTPPSKSKIRK